jgi:exonuclease III
MSKEILYPQIQGVTGLNAGARQDVVRGLAGSLRCDVVCLQETKMTEVSRFLVTRMLGPDFKNFVVMPSVGASGGILVAWRDRLSYQGLYRIDSHSVSVQFGSAQGSPWWLTCVYDPQGNEAKVQFFMELREVRAECAGPWVVVGDFNLIFQDEDKNNSNLDRAMMGRFWRWINDLALKEVPLIGKKITWSNGQANPTLVRLDRVFCSVDWEELFPNCLLQNSATQDSDHCPLVLGLQDFKHGKRRFHFEEFWPKLGGFQDVVATGWSLVLTGPCPLVTLSLKLKATAEGLLSWSKKKVGHVQSQWWLAKEVLHQLEIAQDSRALAENEDWLKNTLKKHCLALSSLRRTIARLRSRISWIKDGDANTALFHAQARFRKGKKFISKIIDDDGRTLTSHDDKAAQFFSFYSGLLESCEVRDTNIDLDAQGMPSFDLAALDAPFSEEEVWDTIKNLPSDKAPGPDGFTGRFYKACWLMIKDDIMAAISWVWARKFRNMDLLNAAYMSCGASPITVGGAQETGGALQKEQQPVPRQQQKRKAKKSVARRRKESKDMQPPPL